MNHDQISPRLAAMRDALVAEVDATSATGAPLRRRRRPTRGTVLTIAAAFLAGSAVTGGITAAALPSSDPDAALESTLATSTRYMVEDVNHATILGTPAFASTQGDGSFSLGARPADADRVTLTWKCLAPATFTVAVDGTTVDGPTRCTPGATGAHWSLSPATGSGRASVTVSVMGGGSGRYAVWASWAESAPIADPSAQQRAEIRDGRITLDEYRNAFNRLEACLTQAGHPMDDVPLSWFANGSWTSRPVGTGPWYLYSTPAEGLEVFDTQCYPREFGQVDALWQAEHPMPEDLPAQPAG
ncbi:hypothetical protein [Curtobacterium flaccumfaciens]|uniref:hypothetical protein n=1 Tax=Curtobacterium flaccumfaciens TaxID=2035 RepID=UPI001128B169|nr:hypothetical protein [Curtobacterium flaccumfaciens]TPG04209.1 hypothetical protein EAH85_17520 [Curtobacterium flaccumfaciens]